MQKRIFILTNHMQKNHNKNNSILLFLDKKEYQIENDIAHQKDHININLSLKEFL